jgi:D-alanyl-D-alanine carboxypeptidase
MPMFARKGCVDSVQSSSKAERSIFVGVLLAASSLAQAGCGAPPDIGPSPVINGAGNEDPSTARSPSVPEASAPNGGANAGEVESPPPPCDDAQTAAIQKSFEDETIPAEIGAVAMIKDRSCGVRYFTRGASKGVSRDAVHLIGSATKTYVASTILLLAEEGKLSLNDSVKKWFPNAPGGDAVKVQNLLDHTSGIYNFSNDTLAYMFPAFLLKAKFTPNQLVNMAFGKAPTFAAGTPGKWEYSNTNYVMLGMIIEAVTGKPITNVIRERILTPIGAKSTFYYGYEPVVGTFAFGRSFLNTPGATALDPSSIWACGNMASTLDDLVDWTERRGSGAFHSAAMQAKLTAGVPTTMPKVGYGDALVIVDKESTSLNHNGPAIGHGGDIVGYHNANYYFPNKKATISVMVLSDKGPSGSFPFGGTYLEPMLMTVVNPYFGTTAPKTTP